MKQASQRKRQIETYIGKKDGVKGGWTQNVLNVCYSRSFEKMNGSLLLSFFLLCAAVSLCNYVFSGCLWPWLFVAENNPTELSDAINSKKKLKEKTLRLTAQNTKRIKNSTPKDDCVFFNSFPMFRLLRLCQNKKVHSTKTAVKLSMMLK